jgi:hypothetical protein
MKAHDIPRTELPRVIGALEGRRVALTIPEAGSTGVVLTADGHLVGYGEQRRDDELQWFAFHIQAVRDDSQPKTGVILDPSFVHSARWTFDDEDEIATLVIATTKLMIHLAVAGAYADLPEHARPSA